MILGRTVFPQWIGFLPDREFRRCAARYGDDQKVRRFSCRDQFLAMAFAQLTYRESLRDIEACLRSLGGKFYHMGFRGKVARSTLADANESRDWRIFADFAQVLIRIARPLYAHDPIGIDLDPPRSPRRGWAWRGLADGCCCEGIAQMICYLVSWVWGTGPSTLGRTENLRFGAAGLFAPLLHL